MSEYICRNCSDGSDLYRFTVSKDGEYCVFAEMCPKCGSEEAIEYL